MPFTCSMCFNMCMRGGCVFSYMLSDFYFNFTHNYVGVRKYLWHPVMLACVFVCMRVLECVCVCLSVFECVVRAQVCMCLQIKGLNFITAKSFIFSRDTNETHPRASRATLQRAATCLAASKAQTPFCVPLQVHALYIHAQKQTHALKHILTYMRTRPNKLMIIIHTYIHAYTHSRTVHVCTQLRACAHAHVHKRTLCTREACSPLISTPHLHTRPLMLLTNASFL